MQRLSTGGCGRAIRLTRLGKPIWSLIPDRQRLSTLRAGRSRPRQSKWAGPRVGAPRTALATAPFLAATCLKRKRAACDQQWAPVQGGMPNKGIRRSEARPSTKGQGRVRATGQARNRPGGRPGLSRAGAVDSGGLAPEQSPLGVPALPVLIQSSSRCGPSCMLGTDISARIAASSHMLPPSWWA